MIDELVKLFDNDDFKIIYFSFLERMKRRRESYVRLCDSSQTESNYYFIEYH